MPLLSVPLGTVLMFHADSANETLPFQYAYCDGSSLTAGNHDVPNASGSLSYTLVLPDLRNRFILGANRTQPFGSGPGAVGGLHATVLTVASLPNHSHGATATSAGAHSHSFFVLGDSTPAHSHASNPGGYFYGATSGAGGGTPIGGFTDNFLYPTGTAGSTTTDGAHAHNVTAFAVGSHSHTITIDPAGSNTAWDNRPNFYGIVYIMKVRT